MFGHCFQPDMQYAFRHPRSRRLFTLRERSPTFDLILALPGHAMVAVPSPGAMPAACLKHPRGPPPEARADTRRDFGADATCVMALGWAGLT